MRTTFMAKASEVERKWLLIDAEGKTLGRLTSEVASLLRGKHKPTFTPHVDCGDHVIIINAEKIKLTGNKLNDKIYYRHSGHPGGLKSQTAKELLAKRPERMLELAIKGMLPKGSLGRQQSTNSTFTLELNTSTKHKNQKFTNFAVNRDTGRN